MESQILGLPLEMAFAKLGEHAGDYTVTYTQPRHPRDHGQLRVVRVREKEITVAPFLTQLHPKETDA